MNNNGGTPTLQQITAVNALQNQLALAQSLPLQGLNANNLQGNAVANALLMGNPVGVPCQIAGGGQIVGQGQVGQANVSSMPVSTSGGPPNMGQQGGNQHTNNNTVGGQVSSSQVQQIGGGGQNNAQNNQIMMSGPGGPQNQNQMSQNPNGNNLNQNNTQQQQSNTAIIIINNGNPQNAPTSCTSSTVSEGNGFLGSDSMLSPAAIQKIHAILAQHNITNIENIVFLQHQNGGVVLMSVPHGMNEMQKKKYAKDRVISSIWHVLDVN